MNGTEGLEEKLQQLLIIIVMVVQFFILILRRHSHQRRRLGICLIILQMLELHILLLLQKSRLVKIIMLFLERFAQSAENQLILNIVELLVFMFQLKPIQKQEKKNGL